MKDSSCSEAFLLNISFCSFNFTKQKLWGQQSNWFLCSPFFFPPLTSHRNDSSHLMNHTLFPLLCTPKPMITSSSQPLRINCFQIAGVFFFNFFFAAIDFMCVCVYCVCVLVAAYEKVFSPNFSLSDFFDSIWYLPVPSNFAANYRSLWFCSIE